MQCSHCGVGVRQDEVRLHAYQFFRIGSREIGIAAAPAIVNLNITTKNPAQFP